LGFLKGSASEKMEEFEAPYINIFSEMTGKKDAYQTLKEMGKVEFMSSSFIRGVTFDDAIVVVDEFQNFSWQELYSAATRIGRNSKIIFCGDGKQDDLHFKKNDVSGFKEFMEVTRQMNEFRSFRFTTDDIVRSSFVKSWIIACERLGL
jgi:phosphate starvation-inducible protein PhoH